MPEGWLEDTERFIPDPSSKPQDWDDEEDGEWEPVMVRARRPKTCPSVQEGCGCCLWLFCWEFSVETFTSNGNPRAHTHTRTSVVVVALGVSLW